MLERLPEITSVDSPAVYTTLVAALTSFQT